MKRFLKILALLNVSLFIVVCVVDAALDRATQAPNQCTLTVYNEQGQAVLAYTGDLASCKVVAKPVVPHFLHRT